MAPGRNKKWYDNPILVVAVLIVIILALFIIIGFFNSYNTYQQQQSLSPQYQAEAYQVATRCLVQGFTPQYQAEASCSQECLATGIPSQYCQQNSLLQAEAPQVVQMCESGGYNNSYCSNICVADGFPSQYC